MTRERHYRTEAVVLRRSDVGEADRVLTLYSPEQGKFRAVARGVRRPTSRKAGHLELFMRSRALVLQRADLHEVAQAESVEVFLPLRVDLRRLACAFYVAELVLGFTEDGMGQPPLYELLVDTLRRLSAERDLWLVTRYFELHLLSLTGFRPELHVCVSCQEPLDPAHAFYSPAQGGLSCSRCGEGRLDLETVSPQGVEVLRYLQTRPYESCARLPVASRTRAEVESVLRRYDEYILEKEIKSAAFVNDLRRRWAEFECATHVHTDTKEESAR